MTEIYFKLDNKIVGLCSDISISMTRDVGYGGCVGYDGIYSRSNFGVPTCSGTAKQIVLSNQFLTEIFQRGFIHAHAQRLPLQVIIDKDNKIQNLWFSAIDPWYIKYTKTVAVIDVAQFTFENLK